MKKRRKYRPMPDDGLVNYHHCLLPAESVHRIAKHEMIRWDNKMNHGNFLLYNPDYYAAEKRKNYKGSCPYKIGNPGCDCEATKRPCIREFSREYRRGRR